MKTFLRFSAVILAVVLAGCSIELIEGEEPAKKPTPTWQVIGDRVSRTETPQGWIVIYRGYNKAGLTYVPDPNKEWVIR